MKQTPRRSAKSHTLLDAKIKNKTLFIVAFVLIFAVIGVSYLLISRAATVTGDINNDGTVNIADLSLLLASWNQSGKPCATNSQYTCDLNNDGTVNIADLSILLTNWGKTSSTTTGLQGLRISSNRFVDDNGNPVQLRGAFYVSFEWSCVNGGGNSAQPLTQSAINAMLGWKINTIRIGVTEDCWLGINGAPYGTTATSYQQALYNFVKLLHNNGIYTEIGLMYSSIGGTNLSTVQTAMPDEDHAPAFWQSFATYFKGMPDTLLEVYGEPHPSYSGEDPWACWLNGGSSCPSVSYSAAGMQQLVTIIRNTGNDLPIAVPGNDWGNDLSKWLSHKPSDPLNQLAASWDEYFDNGCYASNGSGEANNATCWNDAPAKVAASVPLINSELGEYAHSDTCAWNNMPTYLQWAEAHHVSYVVWKWGVPATAGTCVNMALLKDISGTPSPLYGAGYKSWLAQF